MERESVRLVSAGVIECWFKKPFLTFVLFDTVTEIKLLILNFTSATFL